MAGIIYSTGNASLNPSDRFIPVRQGNNFLDSSFQQDGDFQTMTTLETVDNNGNPFGFKFNPSASQIVLGDFDGSFNGTKIDLKDDNGTGIGGITMDGDGSIFFNAPNPLDGQIFINGFNTIRFATKQLLFFGSTLVQNTSGSTANLHLRVTINGTNYVIELRNP